MPSSPSQPNVPSGSDDASSERDTLNPRTRPMSRRASKGFVIGAFVFIFGLGLVGSYALVDVAETALDQPEIPADTTSDTAIADTTDEGS